MSISQLQGSNIVSQVSFLLLGIIEGTAKDLKETDIIKAQKAFQALIEMCAGNYKNQCIAFRGQVIISINAILHKESSSDIQVYIQVYKHVIFISEIVTGQWLFRVEVIKLRAVRSNA